MDNLVENIVAEEAAKLGFKKKKKLFYCLFKEVTQVISYQKSQWKGDGYLNVGISINALAAETYPKGEHCHIQFRAETFIDDSDSLKLALCRQETWRMEEQDRRHIIQLALASAKMYFFRHTESLISFRNFLHVNPNYLNNVTRVARGFLNVDQLN